MNGNEELLRVARILIKNTETKDVESVNVKHHQFEDGSKGFTIDVKFPKDKAEELEPMTYA